MCGMVWNRVRRWRKLKIKPAQKALVFNSSSSSLCIRTLCTLDLRVTKRFLNHENQMACLSIDWGFKVNGHEAGVSLLDS